MSTMDSGRVVGPDGRGARFMTVQVFDNSGIKRTAIDNVLTDQNGFYQYRARNAGT